jgi:hypothetical protein
MKRLSVGIAALLIGACSPPVAQAPAAPEAVSTDQVNAVALTEEFLVGAWGDNGDCSAPITFNADGTFQNAGGVGRWSLEGDIITMQGQGGAFQLRAEALNQNQILIGNPNGAIGLSQRC